MLRNFLAILLVLTVAGPLAAKPGERTVAKKILDGGQTGPNLLAPGAWRPWDKGFEQEGDFFVCDNGTDAKAQRGVGQSVVLNQTRPDPITAEAWSRAENVGGSPNSDYALYLDLVYMDGTVLWGQTASFPVGSHDWDRREVRILPVKPVKSVSMHLLFRRHTGKVWFRDASLSTYDVPEGAFTFDGVGVTPQGKSVEGFQIRDVSAGSDFVCIEHAALGLRLDSEQTTSNRASFFDVTLSDTTGRDRAVTLLYAIPFQGDGLRWLDNPRRSDLAEPQREYVNATSFKAGANGRLSRYPFGAVARGKTGLGLGIDIAHPAFYRVAYNSGAGELFIAFDVALTPEQPQARLRFCRFEFDENWEFRAALARYYVLYPDQFRRRITCQGLWMPFHKISTVTGWEDFGFRFKEGMNETAWDEAHDIVTFRYTEPMTWWMPMAKKLPRTYNAALAEAQRLADTGNVRALSLFTSGYHDESSSYTLRLIDRPWNDGGVWSLNAMPEIVGKITEFKNKWNAQVRQEHYGSGGLDGEYIDSSEGYVTDELDYRRDHFAAATTPLTFATDSHKPALFRGLIAFEYILGIETDIHSMGRYMMANSTPSRLCWLAPLLDVMGTETNWNSNGNWSPMSDENLLYRRAIAKSKPYCFLMNTNFDAFSYSRVELYMKRCLAYGMFPGFFSHNAAEGHYFSRPELYNRDRPLFKKYIPLCRRVAEAGWEPITNARSSVPEIRIERFGKRYLTIYNDSAISRTATITMENIGKKTATDMVTGKKLSFKNKKAEISLEPGDVALLDLQSQDAQISVSGQ